MSLVNYAVQGGVGVITVDNPPVNALSIGVPRGIIEGLEAGNADPAVKASKRFIAALRVFGTDGTFTPLGFETGEPEKVHAEALKIYDRYVEASPETRDAFLRAVGRIRMRT